MTQNNPQKTTKQTHYQKSSNSTSFENKNNQLSKIKNHLFRDVEIYLQQNKAEILGLKTIDEKTQINGEFFDDFLGNLVLKYIPIDLKDILNLCLEEPSIIADLARFTSGEPTTLMIIKDAIRFYLKDYIYREVGWLMVKRDFDS